MRVLEKDKDGYVLVGGIEVDGTYGVRISVKLPDEMMQVFDYDKMVGDCKDAKNGDYSKTGLCPEAFVTAPVRDFLEAVQKAYAMIDPKVEQHKADYREEFVAIFRSAGLYPVYSREIPNEYCSKHCCIGKPWFLIFSKLGCIKIGWRKSVINIDWSESDIRTDGEKLFVSETVTKGKSYIHAWSDESAAKYLRMLAEGS